VNEFSYGSPHPLNADLRLGKFEADKRTAKLYVDVLSRANAHFHAGSEGVAAGLALFDLESINIRRWQSWAAGVSEANPDDDLVAKLTRDFARVGAVILELRAHPTESIRWAMACLSANRADQDGRATAAALLMLGHASLTLGEPHQAIDYFKQAFEICEDIADVRGLGVALDGLGLAYAASGDYRRAMELHQQALPVSQDQDDRFSECMTLGNLGNAAFALGKYREAIAYHERALALARETGHRISEGKSLGNLGAAVFASKDLVKGMEYYHDALVIARETGNRSFEATILSNCGIAWMAVKNPEKAVAYYEQALHIVRETGNRVSEGRILASLGHAWTKLDNIESALACYEQALQTTRKLGDKVGEANALYYFADHLHAFRHFDFAIFYAEQALGLYEEIGSPLADHVRTELGQWRQQRNAHTVHVLLVRGESPSGDGIYAYVAVRADKLEAFMESQKQPPFFPDEYGIIIESGEGEPSEEVKQRMTREYGFNHEYANGPGRITGSH
jgi:tetratricopeptide (TPR) repeat protein